MLGNRVLQFALLALAVIGVIVLFAVDRPGEEKLPLTARNTSVDAEHRDPADLSSDAIAQADQSNAVTTPGSVARVAAPEREWTLHLTGTVSSSDEDWAAIEGAEIDVLVWDVDRLRKASFPQQRSNASGEFSFDLPINAGWYDEEYGTLGVYLELNVWAPGYTSEYWDGEIDLTDATNVELELGLSIGGQVSGFVYAADGQPVEADLYLAIDAAMYEASSDENGFYTVPVDVSGVASILARAEPHGTARIEHLVIDFEVRTHVPDLFLSGTGVIGGVLVDPNGEPIAGHRVVAVSDVLVENSDGSPNTWSFLPGEAVENLAEERSDGLLKLTHRTRSDGTFLFEGLRPGRYLLFAQFNSNGLMRETERKLHLTGDLDVKLTLTLHRLVVTVDGAAGAQAIHCIQGAEREEPEFGKSDHQSLEPVSESPVTFEVQPGRTYRVGLNAGTAFYFGYSGSEGPGPWKVPSAQETVHIEEGTYLTRIDLPLDGPHGNLIVEVEDDVDAAGYQVELTSQLSGKRVKSGYVGRDELPLVAELTPGRYAVRVSASLGNMSFTSSSLIAFTGAIDSPEAVANEEYHVDSGWQEIEIQEGDQSSLRFRFGRGGRLRVATPLAVSSSLDPVGSPVSYTMPIEFFSFSSHSEFELENARGERTSTLDFAQPKTPGVTDSGSPEPAWRELRGALPAGSYILRWQSPFDEVLEARFEIRVGELTSLKLESKTR